MSSVSDFIQTQGTNGWQPKLLRAVGLISLIRRDFVCFNYSFPKTTELDIWLNKTAKLQS